MEVIFRVPDDMHVHFRQGEILKKVVLHTSGIFRRALVMPNTTPAILTAEDVKRYRSEILAVAGEGFEPLMTIKLAKSTTPTVIEEAFGAGAIAAKLYPEGVTTNSEDGISIEDIRMLYSIFRTMEKCGMVLSLHGEVPGVFVLDRERAFLKTFEDLTVGFPKLRIVLEHITTRDAVFAVALAREGVAATITPHHMTLTLDDVLCDKQGGNEFLNPHHYCKPVAKTTQDRDVLLRVATSGCNRFFLGSDSAPHLRGKKECSSGCAGVWNAPVLMPLLVDIFHKCGHIKRLEAFTSQFGAEFYRLPLNIGNVTYANIEPVKFAQELDGIVPFWAGREVSWQQV